MLEIHKLRGKKVKIRMMRNIIYKLHKERGARKDKIGRKVEW